MLPEFISRYVSAVKYAILHPISTQKVIFNEVRHSGPALFLINLFLVALIFFVSFIFSVIAYAILYKMLIPSAMQSEAIIFSHAINGSEARIFNPQAKFPICNAFGSYSNEHTIGNYDKYCITHNSSHFLFSLETYDINLKLVTAPVLHDEIENEFAVQTELINNLGKSITYETLGTLNDPVSQMYIPMRFAYKIARRLLSLDSSVIAELKLIEGFDNSFFDIKAINIRIKEKQLYVREAYLTVAPQLKGLRYFMVNWFWTVMFIFMFNTTPWIFALGVGLLYLRRRNQAKVVKEQ